MKLSCEECGVIHESNFDREIPPEDQKIRAHNYMMSDKWLEEFIRELDTTGSKVSVRTDRVSRDS